MVSQVTIEPPSVRQDGFGTRLIEQSPLHGRVERLELSSALATSGSELAIRARAAHLTSICPEPVGRIFRIERKGTGLTILGEVPDGATLSDILAALEFGTLTLSDDEVVELMASLVDAAGRMHGAFGSLAHGALSPAHVVLTRQGSTVFTGAVFGDAIYNLKRSREHIWREFNLALPASASVPRFDQRSDVAQLGALVLAIGQRRSLRRDEYPQGIGTLVEATSIGPTPQTNSRLHVWLGDVLQLHGRVVFDSCVAAACKFKRFLPKSCGDDAGALALQTAIRQLCGEPTGLWPPASPHEWGVASAGRGSRHVSRHS